MIFERLKTVFINYVLNDLQAAGQDHVRNILCGLSGCTNEELEELALDVLIPPKKELSEENEMTWQEALDILRSNAENSMVNIVEQELRSRPDKSYLQSLQETVEDMLKQFVKEDKAADIYEKDSEQFAECLIKKILENTEKPAQSLITWSYAIKQLEQSGTISRSALRSIQKEINARPSRKDILDLEWEFKVNLCFFVNNKKDLDTKAAIYAKAMIANAINGYGMIYYIDDFIEDVKDRCIIDYDGTGYELDSETMSDENRRQTRCDVEYLISLKSRGVEYIAWYNK